MIFSHFRSFETPRKRFQKHFSYYLKVIRKVLLKTFFGSVQIISRLDSKSRVKVRPVPNAAPLMCRTKLNTVRLWSDFGATADSDGVLASDLIREDHGKYFSMRKICDLNSLTLSK